MASMGQNFNSLSLRISVFLFSINLMSESIFKANYVIPVLASPLKHFI